MFHGFIGHADGSIEYMGEFSSHQEGIDWTVARMGSDDLAAVVIADTYRAARIDAEGVFAEIRAELA